MMQLNRTAVWILLATLSSAVAAAQNSGADIYKAKCLVCHGASGDGKTPAGQAMKAASFSSPEVTKQSDADLSAVIRKGKGKMPAWKGALSDDQIKDVLAYIHTLQK
jgi:mono/diheme cytochrome c family protein